MPQFPSAFKKNGIVLWREAFRRVIPDTKIRNAWGAVVLPTLLFSYWVLAAVLLVALPGAAFLGWKTGHITHLKRGYDHTPPSSYPGDTSRGAMLAILGLLIAFTFGFALTRAEARKIYQIDEAAAISTAFLKADLLEEPGRSALRTALFEYAETRNADRYIAGKEGIADFLVRTREKQALLWPTMLAAFDEETPPPIRALIASSLTEVLDAHTYRLTAGTDYLPLVAKLMLFIVALSSLFFVGNNSGLRGRALTWRTFIMSFVQAVVMIVIIDFERGQEGFIRLDTFVMEQTVAEMQAQMN